MSNVYDDYTDGNKKQVKILPVNELAQLGALLRSNLIARIKDQMIYVKSTCQGWLMMNNGKTGNWINRWVELRDTRLFYYKDSQSLDYINVIDIDGYDVGDFAGKSYSFVATKCGEKCYYFCTHTTEEMKRWKKALGKAISLSKQKAIPLPQPGALSFYINEKQLHIDIPMGDLYWWLETLCDSSEAKKRVMNSFYRNDDGLVKSAVVITVTINGKTLIGHLEYIKNSITLKFDSIQTSSATFLKDLFLDNGKLHASCDEEKANADQKQSEKGRSAKEKKMEAAINKLQGQLQSEKESATETCVLVEMKDKQMQEALDKHVETLQELLQSEKDNSTKARALADEKEKELQLALEKMVKEHDDLERMVQREKDNVVKAQAMVEEKEKELQSALTELNILKDKLEMQSSHSTQPITEERSARVIKPGKVHNLVALFSKNECNVLRGEPQSRRPLQTQFSLPERYRN